MIYQPKKIKTIDLHYVINKMDLPGDEKREMITLMNFHLWSITDVMKATKSDIKLGGNMWLKNPKFKKKNKFFTKTVKT